MKSTPIFIFLILLSLALGAVNMLYPSKIFSIATLVSILGVGGIKILESSPSQQAPLREKHEEGEEITQELNALMNDAHDGIIIYDKQFKITKMNEAAETILGVKREEVIDKTITPAQVKDPKLKILTQIIFPTLAPVVNQISEGWPQITSIEFDNPPLKIQITMNQIKNDMGDAIAFFKVIHDETREKSILESKSEFITVAAHQLRTPLTAINWAFEHLSKSDTSENLKPVIEEGYNLSQRTLKIVNDLLDASRIEGGKFGFALQSMNVIDVIKEVVEQLQPVAKEYGIQVNITKPEEVHMVKVDPQKLGMALFNIIDNGIRYNTESGSVEIQTEKTTDNKHVIVIIKDTGVGIPAQEVQKLFGKFYRGTNVVQLEPNGSGLGLYITKNIIEGHGGKIEVNSIMNRGTTFRITLPLNSS